MKIIELECEFCKLKFNKEETYYNKLKRKGRNEFFCSLSCSSK
jgi:hypothetical protein